MHSYSAAAAALSLAVIATTIVPSTFAVPVPDLIAKKTVESSSAILLGREGAYETDVISRSEYPIERRATSQPPTDTDLAVQNAAAAKPASRSSAKDPVSDVSPGHGSSASSSNSGTLNFGRPYGLDFTLQSASTSKGDSNLSDMLPPPNRQQQSAGTVAKAGGVPSQPSNSSTAKRNFRLDSITERDLEVVGRGYESERSLAELA